MIGQTASNAPIVALLWTLVVATAAVLLSSISRTEAFPTPSISNRRQQQQQHQHQTQKGFSNSIPSPKANVVVSFALPLKEDNGETDGLDGAKNESIFLPKLLDGLAFNLFGIGRKNDEDPTNGAFQPPKDSMTGSVVLITGASSGLGLESAKRLALSGATVIATAKTPSKASETVQAVRNYCRGGPNPGSHGRGSFVNNDPIVRGITLDLADLSSVRSFPDRYRNSMLSLSKISNRDEASGKMADLSPRTTTTNTINVLMNNAIGGSVAKRELTVDGVETIFQSGYLGHFVLTARLFEEGLLNGIDKTIETSNSSERRTGCTVINVSSSAHRSAEIYTGSNTVEQSPSYGFDLNNLNSDLEFSLNTYSRTKLSNIMFTKELQKRADDEQPNNNNNSSSNSSNSSWLTAVSVEPGVVHTQIWKNSVPPDASLKDQFLPVILTKCMTKVERGANAQVWLAYASSSNNKTNSNSNSNGNIHLIGGQHYDETRIPIPSSRFANNQGLNQKLWELSEELGNIKFNLEISPK